jgi:hypothetical protein
VYSDEDIDKLLDRSDLWDEQRREREKAAEEEEEEEYLKAFKVRRSGF